MDNEVQIYIEGQQLDLSDIQSLPLTISYKLEDKASFQKKTGSSALSVKVPATKTNDKISDLYHNPSVDDLTTDQVFRSVRKAKIIVRGQELLTGKAFLRSAEHDSKPKQYEYDFYGNNSDWVIDLKEITFYDLLKDISILFTKSNIIDSWNYDGTDPSLPYVFAPVRYGNAMETANHPVTGESIEDLNMRPDYMKPALSKYWIIFRAFKLVGYKINSEFFDSEYFRRQVMPWVWGSFLNSDGTRLDVLKFLAKSTDTFNTGSDYTGIINANVTNDSTNGAYDDNNVYDYVNNNEMRWKYITTPQFNFGILEVTLHINMFVNVEVKSGSTARIRTQWYKNGVRQVRAGDDANGTQVLNLDAPAIGTRRFLGPIEDWFSINVNQGDTISCKIYVHVHDSALGSAAFQLTVDEFNVDYFRIPLGGTISLANNLALKNYKFLDFLGGVLDEFDVIVQTDSATKTVYFEPCHPYSITNDLSQKTGGYFNGDYLDWTDKQDLSKESQLEPFTDSERELIFKYKDDPNDGTLKKVQDRNSSIISKAKFVFPERFTAGTNTIENRFFAPTMHYDVKQWKFGSQEPPQMIVLLPENISNTSAGEAQNTFAPKSVYYKGKNENYLWMFDNEITHPYPEMFAVNYKPGGENDPILSYCDEVIQDKIGKGLLRRFYLQRLIIMRDGQYYTTYFRLNNKDASNFLHREFILCRGQKWELIQMDYKSQSHESTKCLLRKWMPVR